MRNITAKILLSAFSLLMLGLALPIQAKAAGVIVEPLIIDQQGLPRDIIKGSFKITNPNQYKTTIFTTTKNIDSSNGNQNFTETGAADLSSSLANWISVSNKMLELQPGETQTIPYQIEINLRAKPGTYHAVMFFPQGASRDEANANLNSSPKINVNVTVGSDSKERLQVAQFKGPGIVLGFNAGFGVKINNTGNTELLPKGEIRIYNRNGEEIATLPLNADGQSVSPDEQKTFTQIWKNARGFGKYKAQIMLEFGNKQYQTYQDTIYFWLLPWPLLIFLIMILSGVALLLVYTVHLSHKKKLQEQEAYYENLLQQKVRKEKRTVVKSAQPKKRNEK